MLIGHAVELADELAAQRVELGIVGSVVGGRRVAEPDRVRAVVRGAPLLAQQSRE